MKPFCSVELPRVFFGLAAVCGFLFLSACTSFQIRTQAINLSESGFLAKVPQTPRQQEAYAALPAYVLLRGVAGGNAFYVFKDEKAGAVYIGGEAEYERYMIKVRRLVAYFETTEARMAARDMDGNLQGLVYGAWGAFMPRQNM